MITLYTFGPYFGLPDGSPFVLKGMLLLKFAGLAFREDRGGYGKAPKGKLPYLDDDGTIVADSTLIRLHLEERHGIDFDAGLSERDRAVSWAVEKMCEDHLYWAMVHARWMDDGNFARGPIQFFAAVPKPIRGIVTTLIRRKVRGGLRAHGLGRHAVADIERLAVRDLAAISEILGDKPYLMGDRPCAADAAVLGMVAGLLAPTFETPVRTFAESRPNLVAYRDRLMGEYFSDGAAG